MTDYVFTWDDYRTETEDFSWSGYRCELLDEEVIPADELEQMVTFARDAHDTGNAVAALSLLVYSLHYDLSPPIHVRRMLLQGLDSYFEDHYCKKSLERHLGLTRPGKNPPHIAHARRTQERMFFRAVHALYSRTHLNGAEAVFLVYQNQRNCYFEPDEVPSVDALTKRWKEWREYFEDEHLMIGDPASDQLSSFHEWLTELEPAAREMGPRTVVRLAEARRAVEQRIGADAASSAKGRGLGE